MIFCFVSDAVAESSFAADAKASLLAAMAGLPTTAEAEPIGLVCFGVGCVATSHVAQHQAGLLLQMREWLASTGATVEPFQVYDPIFCEEEKSAFKALGSHVLSTNHDGAHALPLGHRCVVYMPHCEAELYNNLLAANWGNQLQRLVILGNGLRSYAERLPTGRWEAHMCAVARSLPWLQDTCLPNTYKPADVFNDTSFHIWPAAAAAAEQEWATLPAVAPLPLPDPGAGGPKPKFAPAV